MSVFHFKKFDIVNERSAMKVNTDGVLLGARVELCSGWREVLDIGTGTGTIALMAAQRLSGLGLTDFRITGIDIDEPSASEAGANFAASPWAERLEALNCPLEQFRKSDTRKFDLILSNPPYFDDSLNNPDGRKNEARHSVSLSYREILSFAQEALSEDGRVALVLPAEEEQRLLREGRSLSLFPRRITSVRTTTRKAPKRIIVEFGRGRCECEKSVLTIQSEGGYTEEYLSLTRDFYLFS